MASLPDIFYHIAVPRAKSAEFPSVSANLLSRPASARMFSPMPKARLVVVLVVPPIEELDLISPTIWGGATCPTSALADRVSMSVRNFARRFTADVGTTPARYVLHLRVEAARRLLQSSSHDLQHIASVAGFGSVDGMGRAFVRVLGQSPRDVRAVRAR
jgi:AraC-like DNA-binding protein